MKNIYLSVILVMLTTASSFAGFGLPNIPTSIPGMDKIPGMGPVTAESLLATVLDGSDYFWRAQMKYYEALHGKSAELAEWNNEYRAAKEKGDANNALLCSKKLVAQNKAKSDEMEKSGQKLSAEAKQIISDGNKEALKGAAKWAFLVVGIAQAAKSGNTDEKLLAAIVVAKQAAADLPALKAMMDTMKKLKVQEAESKA